MGTYQPLEAKSSLVGPQTPILVGKRVRTRVWGSREGYVKGLCVSVSGERGDPQDGVTPTSVVKVLREVGGTVVRGKWGVGRGGGLVSRRGLDGALDYKRCT